MSKWTISGSISPIICPNLSIRSIIGLWDFALVFKYFTKYSNVERSNAAILTTLSTLQTSTYINIICTRHPPYTDSFFPPLSLLLYNVRVCVRVTNRWVFWLLGSILFAALLISFNKTFWGVKKSSGRGTNSHRWPRQCDCLLFL